MAPRYDAVLFDLDDTLWHFEESPAPEEISRALATLDHRHFAMMRPRHIGALELLPQ